MPRVHWDDKISEIHVYADDGYGTGSQESFSPDLTRTCVTSRSWSLGYRALLCDWSVLLHTLVGSDIGLQQRQHPCPVRVG